MSQFILGIKPDFDGLLIDPCIPSELSEIKLTRKFRGNTYHITIDNSAHVESGIAKVIVGGNEYDSNLIKTTSSNSDISVTVVMGENKLSHNINMVIESQIDNRELVESK